MFPLLNLHPEGTPNTKTTKALKGGMSISCVKQAASSGGRSWGVEDRVEVSLTHYQQWPAINW